MLYTDVVRRTRPLVYLPLGAARPPGNYFRNLGTYTATAIDDGGSQPSPTGTLGPAMGPATLFPTPGQNADKVFVATDPSMDVVTFTVMAWVRRDAAGTTRIIASRDATTGWNRFWHWTFNTSNQMELVQPVAVTTATSTATLADTQRSHQVVVVVASTAVNFYLDGIDAGSGTITEVPTTGTCPFAVGNFSSNQSTHFTGQIGHAAFWTRALNLSEITRLYKAGRNGETY